MRTKTYLNKKLFILLQGYSLLLIIGGVFAHTSYSSKVIMASVICGLIMQVGAWLVWLEKRGALLFNLISLLALSSFFIYRWILIRKFYPPGFLLLFSLFLIYKIARALIQQKKIH